jgi:hypothetical protein
MKRTFIKQQLLTLLAILATFSAFAQTSITTGVVTPTAVCAGGTMSVAFTFVGVLPPANSYEVQLSNTAGTFGVPVKIGAGASAPIPVTIPAGTATSATYKVRVISVVTATPGVAVVTGSESAPFSITAIPATPTVTSPVNYNVGAVSSVLTATGANLKWYDVAIGGTALPGAPTPLTTVAGTKSYYVSQTVGSCESARAEIVVNVTCVTALPTVTSPINYNVGAASSVLTATGANLKWYDVAIGGTALPGAPTPLTTVAGTKSYYVSQTVGSCESARAEIVVNVTCATPLPTVTSPINYNVGAASSVLTATGVNLKWYDVAIGGTAVPGAPTPLTTAAVIGTKSYYVSQTVGACESARAEIVVNVTCATAAATVTTPVNYFVGNTPVALTAGGTSLKWYNVPTGGSPLPTAPVPTATAAGTTSYYVSQTLNGCEGPRTEIKVIVNSCATVAPTVTTTQVNYNVGAVAAALTATGTDLKWYTVATGGTALPGAPTPLTTAAAIGTTSYYVGQTVGGCEGPRVKIDVVVTCATTAPTVTTPVNYVTGATPAALVATGASLLWYTTASGGTGSATAPIPSTNAADTISYFVSQTVNNCEGPRAEIKVIVTCSTVVPTVSSPVVYCFGDSAITLTAGGTALKWYTVVTGGTALGAAPRPATNVAGTKSYWVAQTLFGCEGPRAEIKVTVNQTPAPTVLPVEYCLNAPTVALTATGTGLKWYAAATGGTPLATVPKPLSTTVGVVSYFVSQILNGCESARAVITVTTKALPAAPVVSGVSYCQNAPAVPLTATGTNLLWYGTDVTGGTGSATAPTPTTGGTATYYVSQTGANECEGPRAALVVTIKPLPAQPVTPKSLVEYCQFASTTALEANVITGATLNWYGTNATGGSATGERPTPTSIEGGTTSYYVSQTLNGCESNRAKIDVRINTTPKPAATTQYSLCQGAAAPPLVATGTNLKWYRPDGVTSQTDPLIIFTLKVEDYSFYVTQTGSNGCESPKEEIKIHIKSLPSATISGNSSIGRGEPANVRLDFTGDGPWTYKLSNGLTGTSNDASTNVSVSPGITTTYVVTEVSNACGKGVPVGSAVVTVRVPTISTGNPSVADVCAGKTFQVGYQQSGAFPSGYTFVVQIAQLNTDAQFKTIPSVATSSQITATIPDTTRGGSYFVRIVNEGADPAFRTTGSVAGINLTVNPLSVGTISGSKTILIGESADLKVEFVGKAPWTFNLNDGTKDSLITANVTPYGFLLKPKVTTTYTVNSITNVCGTVAKGQGAARIQVDPILGMEPAVTNFARVYPTITDVQCIVELDEALSSRQSGITLIDLTGRTIMQQKIKHKLTEVDLSAYPAGLYLLKVSNGNHTSVHRVLKR